MKNVLIFVGFIAALTLSAFFHTSNFSSVKQIQIGNSILNNIEIADTDAKRELGLSGKTSIDSNYGMLFIFEKHNIYGFWMKDMNFPIDIIWLDENFEVTGIKEDASPSSYPEVFYPEKKSKYVLEVESGFSKKESLKLGSRVIFSN